MPMLSMQFGRTALLCAAMKGHSSTVELLLNHGAQIEFQNQSRKTARVREGEGRGGGEGMGVGVTVRLWGLALGLGLGFEDAAGARMLRFRGWVFEICTALVIASVAKVILHI